MRRYATLARALVCAAFALVRWENANATDWPQHPVRVIVPFAPGGSTDAVARPFAEALSRVFGQQFVIDNKGGAGGALGTEAMVKSAPDGYTICVCPSGSFTIIPHLRPLPYARDDAVAVARAGTYLAGLTVHPSLGVRTVQEFVALAKAKPGKINFASSGLGTVSHIRVEILKRAVGIDLVHVPYRGSAEALNDLLADHVQVMIENIVYPHVKAGKLTMLAMLADKRHPDFPDVPTAAEAGIADVATPLWWGFFAPAGTPQPILDRLNAEAVKIAGTEEMRDRLLRMGFAAGTDDMPSLRADVLKQDGIYKKIIAEAAIRNE
jgi:tripartite-type tricarboxylate transporter receptor subunit TctC